MSESDISCLEYYLFQALNESEASKVFPNEPPFFFVPEFFDITYMAIRSVVLHLNFYLNT